MSSTIKFNLLQQAITKKNSTLLKDKHNWQITCNKLARQKESIKIEILKI